MQNNFISIGFGILLSSQLVLGAAVTVTAPSNNATVKSPFTLKAQSSSCSSQPVTAMAYSVGNGKDSPTVNGTSLDTQVTASVGQKQVLHVKSWGNKGAGCDTDITINVVASGGVTVSLPTDNATVKSPFTLKAQSASCDGEPVTTMAYSINNEQDSPAVNGTSLNTQVTASPGSNQILHIKSWGPNGAACSSDININIAVTEGVTVTSPAENASVTSPFTLQAQSPICDGEPVATMAYSLGDGADSPAIKGTSLNAQVSASVGQNQILHVKSWGPNGAACDTDVTVNVGGGLNGSYNIPIPPSSAYHVSKIQETTSWKGSTGAASQCPNGVSSPTCNPVTANFDPYIKQGSDPISLTGSDGVAGEFEIFQGPANATAIWGHSVMTEITPRNFIWDFNVYVDSSNYSASELDLYTSLNNGQRFMMGSQCNRGTNTWDTWSEANQHWIHNSSVECNSNLTPNSWHHVIFYNTVDANNNTYTYQVLRIDGVDYVLNQTQSTKDVGWPDGLVGVQVQLDTNSSGLGVNEFVENMQIYAW